MRAAPLGTGQLLGGLLLALASAALINLGFLLQHRGLGEQGRLPGAAALWRALRNRTWLGGQAIGWIGFGAQIVAVAIAPLALVQAFAAGGLALSVPLASRFFSHRIGRAQVGAVVAIAVGLGVLAIGIGGRADRVHGEALVIMTAGALAVGVAVACWRSVGAHRIGAFRALAAGIFYGVADAAIKAISVSWRGPHGSLPAGWLTLAALGTLAGFLAFQSALHEGSAVSAISLMNALATLVALACGLLGFGESLGAGAAMDVVHVAAIGIVLACVPVLAAAQAELADSLQPAVARPATGVGGSPPAGAIGAGLARPPRGAAPAPAAIAAPAPGQRATGGQHHRLQHGAQPGATAEQDVAEP